MPLDIDPRWEYWEPDPEIREAMFVRAHLSALDPLMDIRELSRTGSAGFRLGNPNHCRFRLRREKYKPPVEEIQPRPCKGCGTVFTPDRDSRSYCSVGCIVRKGPEKVLPLSRACECCGKEFPPVNSSHRYCGHVCAGRQGTPSTSVDLARLAGLYEEGLPMADISKIVGVSVGQCKKLRRRLGLVPRGPHGKGQETGS